MRPRVLIMTSVFPRFPSDATPPFIRNLSLALSQSGWDVCVLAPHGPGAQFSEADNGINVVRFPYMFPLSAQRLCYEGGMLINLRERPWTNLLLPFFFIAQLWALWRLARRFNPDVLHSHSLLPQGFTTRIIASLLKLPHVTTCHGNDVFGLKTTGLMGLMKRHVLRRVDAITVNSSATRDAVRSEGGPAERIELIPSVPNEAPIDPEKVAALRQEWGISTPVILFVGRLIAEKGVGELLTAMSLLHREQPDLRLVLLGDGAERERLTAHARDLGLLEVVEFAGWVPGNDVTSYMAAADIVVVPSRLSGTGWVEAQGLVAVEAMSVGTPVVASAFGGLVDMIEDGVTGYHCAPGDSDSLAAALLRALGDPDRATVVQNARHRYEQKFSKESVVAATVRLYTRLLKEPRIR